MRLIIIDSDLMSVYFMVLTFLALVHLPYTVLVLPVALLVTLVMARTLI